MSKRFLPGTAAFVTIGTLAAMPIEPSENAAAQNNPVLNNVIHAGLLKVGDTITAVISEAIAASIEPTSRAWF